jgi:hypothetical protein
MKTEANEERNGALKRVSASLLALVIVGVGVYACTDVESHIFSGRLYESARNCVDTTTGFDVVDGVEPETPCSPQCLVVPTYDGEGGTAAYISTMCPPLPPAADTSSSYPRCAPGLAAYNRNDTCEDGGGSTNPPDAAVAVPVSDAAPTDAGPG